MGIARLLTPGEQAYAVSIFGNSIDYTRVRVHNTGFTIFQDDHTAVTPNGEVYFPAAVYRNDFSTDVGNAGWLIHELTHVWQYQHGTNVIVQGILHRDYDYGSLTGSNRSFASFHIEQQASIVADYFYLTHGARPIRGSGTAADYERVIPFLPRRR